MAEQQKAQLRIRKIAPEFTVVVSARMPDEKGAWRDETFEATYELPLTVDELTKHRDELREIRTKEPGKAELQAQATLRRWLKRVKTAPEEGVTADEAREFIIEFPTTCMAANQAFWDNLQHDQLAKNSGALLGALQAARG
jgi:hypothetical protein